MHLLLVEDNRNLADWLSKLLRASRHEVDIAYDGDEADMLLRAGSYETIILDLELPKRSGWEVLRRLRGRADPVPVIVITAHDSLDHRINILDAGADDFLAKPFDAAELEARIRVQVRRAHNRTTTSITCGSLVLDQRTKQFHLGGVVLALTPREHAVLEHLLLRSGETVSKLRIWQAVFGIGDEADPNAIEIYVHRVRRKLEGGDVRIQTLRGLGYMLQSHEA